MTRPEFKLPDVYIDRINSVLVANGSELSNPRAIATAVQKLSDFYISNPDGQTPYDQAWARVAYAAYYFPLNYLRARAVVFEAKRLGFFDGLTSALDFGSGPGTFSLALLDGTAAVENDSSTATQWKNITGIELSPLAIKMHKQLLGSNSIAPNHDWMNAAPKNLDGHLYKGHNRSATHLNSFCYSFTELESLPAWATGSEALMIIEPATQTDGRRLLEERKKILEAGFRIWGPCTHESACPLLERSKRDWCHDRMTWTMPTWFQEIEQHLPIKNRTLTFSWLIARKSPPPPILKSLARLTGDLQREKGSSKQLVCRGSDREFISWQHKNGEPPAFLRGALVHIKEGIPTRSNELRPLIGDVEVAELVLS